MFEAKANLKKAHEKLVALSATYQRGETIPLSEIEKASGIVRYGESWSGIVNKFKKYMLRERGIALWSIENGGYKLLTNQEQVTIPANARMRRARRQCKRAIRELSSAESSDLSVHDRKCQAMRLGWLESQRRQLTRGLRDSVGVKKTEAQPRRQMAVA